MTATLTPNRVQLLIDHLEFDARTLTERREGGKIILRGELARADTVTSNNRLYPRNILEREVGRLRKEAKARKLFGELDHPADGRTQYQRVSHAIRDIWLEDDGRVMGEMEVIPTSKGKDLAAIIEVGMKPGFSSRGTGTTHKREDGVDVVNDDYNMITYDAVADPAHSGAYPEVFFESKDVPNLGRVEMPDKKESLDALISANPALGKQLDAIIKKNVDRVREDVRAEEQERVKGQFESQLLKQLGDLRTEVEEQVKSDMATDPKWADAKRRLEAIRAAIGADGEGIPTEDHKALQKALAEKDAEAKALSGEVEALRKKAEEADAERDKALVAAKKNAIDRFMEKQAQASGNPALFRKLASGRVSENDSADVLKKKVEEVLDIMKSFKAKDEKRAEHLEDLGAKIKEAVKQEVGELKTKVEELERQNKELSEASDRYRKAAAKSLEVARKGFGEAQKYRLFEESKAARHPARNKILTLLEQANLNDKDDIEKFIEEAVRSEGKDSVLLERVQNRVKRGSGSTLDETGQERPSLLNEGKTRDEKLFGVPLSTMRKLAGVKGV